MMKKWLKGAKKSDCDLEDGKASTSSLNANDGTSERKTQTSEEPQAGPSSSSLPVTKEPQAGSSSSALSVTSTLSTPTAPKRKRFNSFCRNWLEVPEFKEWLEKSSETIEGNELAFCKLCNVKITAHKSEINRHSDSDRHTKKLRSVLHVKPISQSVADPVKIAEIKLAGLLAEKNLPFSLMDDLVCLCADLFKKPEVAQELKMRRSKATQIIKKSLGGVLTNNLYKKLQQPGCYFSIIMDETTDLSSTKQCAFTVIYFDEDTGSLETSFFDMVEMTSGTAEDLYSCLMRNLSEKNILMENFVGFSSDTTNVMFGEHKSVVALMKKSIPDIVCIKCSCHMIHLAACKACLLLPRSVEDLLRNLGSHFSRSFSRQSKLKEIQIFFGTEVHKILSPSITRWLSLKACTDRVLEQYEALHAYLRQLVFDDPSKTTDEMLVMMNNTFTKVYLEFLSYALEMVTEFNTMFQGQQPLLYNLKPEVESLLRNICMNFIEAENVRNVDIFSLEHADSNKFMDLEKVYLEIAASESIEHIKQNREIPNVEIIKFLQYCLNFYTTLVTEIKQRFIFSDPVFDLLPILDPKQSQNCDMQHVLKITKRIPLLLKQVCLKDLEKEWRAYKVENTRQILQENPNVLDYWRKIFDIKNNANMNVFVNLKKVIVILLVLPFSNASVERLFSNLKNIKTDNRNSLNTDTIVALLAVREGIRKAGGIVAFQPNAEMLKTRLW